MVKSMKKSFFDMKEEDKIKLSELDEEQLRVILKKMFEADTIEKLEDGRGIKVHERVHAFTVTPMDMYDVLEYLRYDSTDDSLEVTYNYGDAKLRYENVSDEIVFKNEDGELNIIDMTDKLSEWLDDVDSEWKECFQY